MPKTKPEHVAFLRAINLGKLNRLSMPELRELFESFGLGQVRTHLHTGNIIFQNPFDPETLAVGLEQALQDRGCKNVSVILRSGNQLRALAQLNPFRDTPENPRYVTFLRHTSSSLLPRSNPKGDLEVVLTTPNEVCSQANGALHSFPNAFVESKLKVQATTRYWHVVQDVVGLLKD